MAYHPHTGVHYCKLPTYLSDEYGSFTNISDIDLGESGSRQILICLCVINILAMKVTCFG